MKWSSLSSGSLRWIVCLLLLPIQLFALEILTSRTIDTIGTQGSCDTLAVSVTLTAKGDYDTLFSYDTIFSEHRIPIDAMMLLDNSSSMGSGPGSKLEQVKSAASTFARLMANDTNRTSVYQFNTNVPPSGWKLCPFTSDSQTVLNAISGLTMQNGTPLYDALMIGIDSTKSNYNPDHIRVIMLLTDGVNSSSTHTAAQALAAVSLAYATDSIKVFSIGFGTGSIDSTFLKNAANAAGGSYFYAPDSAKLDSVYRAIQHIITNQGFDTTYNATPIPVKPDTIIPEVDMALVLDNSSSMGEMMGTSSKLVKSKAAAKQFAGMFMESDTANRFAVYQFNSSVPASEWLLTPFSSDTGVVYGAIRGITLKNGTPLYDATLLSIGYVRQHFDSTHSPVVTIMTDGKEVSSAATKQAVLDSVAAAWQNYGIRTFMVGFGDSLDIDHATMRLITAAGGGEYFYAPDSASLVGVYQKITKMVLTNIAAKSMVIEQPLPSGVTYVPGSQILVSKDVSVTFNSVAGTSPKLVWTADYVPVWGSITATYKVVACNAGDPNRTLLCRIKYEDEEGLLHNRTIGQEQPTVAGSNRLNSGLCFSLAQGKLGQLIAEYTLPSAQRVSLAVFTPSGRLVAGLVDGVQSSGRHVVRWKMPHGSSRLYVMRLSAGSHVAARVVVGF